MTSARCASSSHVNTVFGPVSALNSRIFPEVNTEKECNKAGVITSQYLIMTLMLRITVNWPGVLQAPESFPVSHPTTI